MPRLKFYKVDPRIRAEYLDDFYSAVLGLKSKKEISDFFVDILTPDEAIMIARRLRIAIYLLSGMTTREIVLKMKCGMSTIATVAKWLDRGFGGYRNVVEHLQKYEKAQKGLTKKRIESDMGFTFNSLRKKYPAHFFLLNLFLDRKSK
jgi:TrpR-related protein YerC/YecD